MKAMRIRRGMIANSMIPSSENIFSARTYRPMTRIKIMAMAYNVDHQQVRRVGLTSLNDWKSGGSLTNRRRRSIAAGRGLHEECGRW